VEVFRIVEYARATRKPEQIATLINEVAESVNATKDLTYEQHLATNQRCPPVYGVRPTKGRNFHAQDVEGCRHSYEDPHDLAAPPSYVPALKIAGEASEASFRAAMERAGIDNQTYDLNSALLDVNESRIWQAVQ